jgi:hypothetical protein
MKFMITFTGKPTHFKEAISRFLKTGAAPPDGVKMLGRWHGPFTGWVVAETDELKKVYEWTIQWSDLAVRQSLLRARHRSGARHRRRWRREVPSIPVHEGCALGTPMCPPKRGYVRGHQGAKDNCSGWLTKGNCWDFPKCSRYRAPHAMLHRDSRMPGQS